MKLFLSLAVVGALAVAGMLYTCIVMSARMDDQFQEYTKMKEKGGD